MFDQKRHDTMLLFLVCFLFSAKIVATEDVKDYDIQQLSQLFENLVKYTPVEVTKDVSFYLYTRNISNKELFPNDNTTINVTNTKIVIHGWIDNHNRSWCQRLTSEYLKKGDFNVILVDWWRIAQTVYLSSAFNSKQIGEIIAGFILQKQINPKDVHLIGHSLGAHIAASTAQIIKKNTKIKIARITALDPAGPGFRNMFTANNKLNKDDANIVDVFHTDGGGFGTYEQTGTFDIYFNGGVRVQPQCRFVVPDLTHPGELFEHSYCSHTRSYIYFIDMINNSKYSCRKCPNVIQYFAGFCKSTTRYHFGVEDVNAEMNGVCFVSTL